MAAAPSSLHGHSRTILHFDLNCFYAQSEIIRRPGVHSRQHVLHPLPCLVAVSSPELKDKPVGVRQKYLLVTSNYVARSLGVGK
jgi:DNA polymerase iota